MNYLTLPDSIPQPLVCTFPFYLPQYYQSPVQGNMVYGAAPITTSVNPITLQSIPSRILIWCTPNQNYWDYTTSDTYAFISKIQILFDNQSAILSQASAEDLYIESVQNGLQMSWTEWSQTVGSVIIVDVTKNLPLTNLEEAPGLCCTKQIQIIVNTSSLNYRLDTGLGRGYTVWMATINSGIMSIENGSTSLQSAILSRTGIMEAVSNPKRVLNEVSVTPYGGALSGGGKIRKWVEKAHKNFESLMTQPKAMNDIYQQQQQQQQQQHGMELGYRMNPALAVGSYRGGAFISKNILKRKANDGAVEMFNFAKDQHRFEELTDESDEF